MPVITTIPATNGLKDIFRDQVWRIARVCCPKLVLKYHPSLADIRDADYFAVQRNLSVVERHGVWVATVQQNDDEYDALFWQQPELIEIAACQRAWQLLPVRLQLAIWRRLLGMIGGDESVVHDRPEIRRLAEATFRTREVRAIEQDNQRLLEELVVDCPFWQLGREELLKQEACELRRWHRLFRLPKSGQTEFGIEGFVKALWHVAGLIEATCEEREG